MGLMWSFLLIMQFQHFFSHLTWTEYENGELDQSEIWPKTYLLKNRARGVFGRVLILYKHYFLLPTMSYSPCPIKCCSPCPKGIFNSPKRNYSTCITPCRPRPKEIFKLALLQWESRARRGRSWTLRRRKARRPRTSTSIIPSRYIWTTKMIKMFPM